MSDILAPPDTSHCLYALLGALAGALATHWLDRSAASKDRVREARITLRRLIDQARSESGFHAFAAHREFSPVIADLKHTLPDDLPRWRRRRFVRSCDAFLDLPGSALQPRIEPHPTGVPRSTEAKDRDDQELQRPVDLLTDALGSILKNT